MTCLSSAVFAAITALPAITAGKPVLSGNGFLTRRSYQTGKHNPGAAVGTVRKDKDKDTGNGNGGGNGGGGGGGGGGERTGAG